MKLTVAVALPLLLIPGTLFAQEWSRFRGPNGCGIGEMENPPVKWTENDFLWRRELPGKGHSSPVVWGTKLFVTSAEGKGEKRMLHCLDAENGKIRWTVDFESDPHKRHRFNSYASSTPALDAERVYVCWTQPSSILVVALDHDGTEVWRRDLGRFKGGHGFAVSPIVHGGRLFLGNDQDGESSLLALDAANGKVLWEIDRRSRRTTYSSPCVYSGNGKGEMIFANWVHGITAIDPATGAVNWEISPFDQDSKQRAIASPVIAGKKVIATCGFVTGKKRLVVLEPGSHGKMKEQFRIDRSVAHVPTVLVIGARLYMWSDAGIVTCVNLDTGEEIWRERVEGGKYFASPVAIGDKIYNVSAKGDVVVIAASDEFRILGENDLGAESHATPAIANGTLYFRPVSEVFALRGK